MKGREKREKNRDKVRKKEKKIKMENRGDPKFIFLATQLLRYN